MRAGRCQAPLAQCLNDFFAVQGELPKPSSHVTSSSSLLDQLPPVDIALRGHTLPDLLRPAYEALGDGAARGPVASAEETDA